MDYKEQIREMAAKYSKNKDMQRAYKKGFQAACNIVREKISTLYNEDFCDEMDSLANVAYMDVDEE